MAQVLGIERSDVVTDSGAPTAQAWVVLMLEKLALHPGRWLDALVLHRVVGWVRWVAVTRLQARRGDCG